MCPGGMNVRDWFPVNVGLRQGCVMSPGLSNVYMDGVVREVNATILGANRAEAWGMRSADRRKANVLEIKCLRSLVGVSIMDRVRND